MNWATFVEGMTDDLLAEISPERLARAQMMAINTVARDGRSMLARDVRDQVKLPAKAVSPQGKRLYVAQKATQTHREAIIRATGRPTSLAQYTTGPKSKNTEGVMVEVKPGHARLMRRAFYMRLPAGATSTDTKYNLGLAVRLRPGEALRRKLTARKMASGLYLLYGPSVDQIFQSNDGSGLAEDRSPFLADRLEAEFLRLLRL